MEILSDNFEEKFEKISEDIQGSDFIAIDYEVTGTEDYQQGIIDTCQIRYKNILKHASIFRIISLSLCCVLKKSNSYFAKTYKFFVFPSEAPGHFPKINCNLEILKSGQQRDIDFNKWISKGVPYLPEIIEKKLWEEYEKLLEPRKSSEMQINDQKDIELIDQVKQKIKDLISQNTQTQIQIEGLNSFHRRYIYQLLDQTYQQLIAETDDETKTMKIQIVNPEQKQQILEQKLKDKKKEISRKIGFRRVFQKLCESAKILIGHDIFPKLLFIFSHFQGELPDNLQEFKQILQSKFNGSIYDTKLILKILPQFTELSENAPLNHIFQSLQYQNLIQPEAGFQIQNNKSLDSSNNSYMISCIFLQLQQLMDNNQIQKYLNQANLSNCVFSINVSGDDETIYPSDTILGIKLKHEHGINFKDQIGPKSNFTLKQIEYDQYILIVKQDLQQIKMKLFQIGDIQIFTLQELIQFRQQEYFNKQKYKNNPKQYESHNQQQYHYKQQKNTNFKKQNYNQGFAYQKKQKPAQNYEEAKHVKK